MPEGFTVGDIPIGDGDLFLIAGPCVIESETHAMKMAAALARITTEKRIPYIFKASYDKAKKVCGFWPKCVAKPASRCLPMCTKPPTSAELRKLLMFCRFRLSCAARPTSWRRPQRLVGPLM